MSKNIRFHILKESDEAQFRKNNVHIRSQRGISLFDKIPSNRTCLDALIADKFCSCFHQENISEAEFSMDTSGQETFASTALMLVNEINALTSSARDKCAPFELDRVESFKKLVISRIKIYSVVVVLRPGDAWFEANLKLDEGKRRSNGRLKLNGDPTRLSAYGNQSHCVQDLKLVNYCYCNDLL